MPPVGFDPTIPASERLQTHVLDRSDQLLHQCKYLMIFHVPKRYANKERNVFLAQLTLQKYVGE